MAVLVVAVIAAAPVVAAAATATAGGATATGGVAVATATTTTAAGETVAAVSVGVSMGPVGWMVLGSSQNEAGYTLDCWKPVLHDESTEPSNGMILNDLLADPRIKNVKVVTEGSALPEIILENIWEEQFQLEYLELPTAGGNTPALHAKRI